MTDADTAYADEVLAAAAPGKRLEQLARKAAALELKLAPEAVAARKTIAKQDQRVEARREQSGNASLSGRELDTADVIASKAYIDAVALQLRDGGIDGTLGGLRALALSDLTQGRDPLDRIKPPPATQAETASQDNGPAPAAADEASSPAAASSPDALKPALDGAGDPLDHIGQTRPGEPAHLPALINLLVPPGTLLGWSTAPGEAAGWASWTPKKPGPWSRRPPGTREPAGALRSSPPTAPRWPTAAPPGSIPGWKMPRRHQEVRLKPARHLVHRRNAPPTPGTEQLTPPQNRQRSYSAFSGG